LKSYSCYNVNQIKLFQLQLIYIIKELVPPKMSLNREFPIWKEREGVRERRG
jgi:hypothetical protein